MRLRYSVNVSKALVKGTFRHVTEIIWPCFRRAQIERSRSPGAARGRFNAAAVDARCHECGSARGRGSYISAFDVPQISNDKSFRASWREHFHAKSHYPPPRLRAAEILNATAAPRASVGAPR
ncbi:hypothetical protein EVAR_39275_1 [Eumeta japonica]|uniref:Uncharacterized protein n=1 Tax=Eumeta variegata TaxID=151549 RepID=A0A4C1VVM4_EUMVA|nr:hypothetical protein EVAR_39275_1 [Eumeta japonica]